MSSGQAHGVTSDRETARREAKANLLLALYSHASHDLELSRDDANRLRDELADVRKDCEQASGRLREADRQFQEVNGQSREADRQLADARKEMERLHRQLGDVLNERDRLAEGNAQLQQQHDALRASTSWRATAPIRAMARLIKRQ